MNKIKAAILSALLLLFTTGLCLIVAEGTWRLMKGVPLLSRDNLVQQSLDLIRATTGIMVHDPQVGWRLKENTETRGKVLGGLEINMSTGAYGLRMNQRAVRQPSRGGILAVGDSFTAGSGVLDEDAWPARIEILSGQPVENGAAGGYGVDQIVLRTEQLLPALQPKTLIIGILSQDTLRNNYEIYGGGYKPYFVIESGKAVLKGVPVPMIDVTPIEVDWLRSFLGYSHLVDSAVKAFGLQQWWVDNRLRYKKVHEDKVGVEISCHLMRRLAELKTAQGIRVIVVMMYGAGEIEASPAPWFVPPVIACAKQEGLEVLDTYESTRAVLQRDRGTFVELWLNEGGQLGHLSPKGNQFVADLLYRTFLAR
jgi:hypothetical protein